MLFHPSLSLRHRRAQAFNPHLPCSRPTLAPLSSLLPSLSLATIPHTPTRRLHTTSCSAHHCFSTSRRSSCTARARVSKVACLRKAFHTHLDIFVSLIMPLHLFRCSRRHHRRVHNTTRLPEPSSGHPGHAIVTWPPSQDASKGERECVCDKWRRLPSDTTPAFTGPGGCAPRIGIHSLSCTSILSHPMECCMACTVTANPMSIAYESSIASTLLCFDLFCS